VPDLEPAELRTLGLVSLALYFEQYDFSMLTSAWAHITASLGIPESQFGTDLMMIRLGALPALGIAAFADRIGRRRLFLVSLVASSVGTLLTAFSRTPFQFVALQMATRAFMTAGTAVAFVILTEEVPAQHRGWAIGMLGALGSCGIGFGAALFAAVDVLPFGWRTLYGVGVIPLLLLPRFRRGVRETARFERMEAARRGEGALPARRRGTSLTAALATAVHLAREHPRRLAIVAGVAFLSTAGAVSVFQFTSFFTRTVHGWAPWQYSVMVFVGGGIGIIGNIVAGRMGDRFGRRLIGAVTMGAFPVFAAVFYNGPGWSLAPSWIAFVFCVSASNTVQRAFASELFPTAKRGTASGVNALCETLGAASGLGLLALGTQAPGNVARMTTLLSLSLVASGLLVVLLPETRQRELEAISGA
jgi:putative MFS transporter